MKPLLNAATETLITLTHNNEKYGKNILILSEIYETKSKAKRVFVYF